MELFSSEREGEGGGGFEGKWESECVWEGTGAEHLKVERKGIGEVGFVC